MNVLCILIRSIKRNFPLIKKFGLNCMLDKVICKLLRFDLALHTDQSTTISTTGLHFSKKNINGRMIWKKAAMHAQIINAI